jgi:malate dehydrogenase (oxaloacetate-decarboxylating)(NADP+)
MKGADVFVGLSKGNVVSKEMLKAMAKNPIVFALANPDPEITYEDAMDARKDIIMATGRSDYPNQVNNVLGFPFIFRGALDVRAKKINEEMKMAATRALAGLAKLKVPEAVLNAYGGKDFSFGKEYIIPKPFDPRVLWTVAPAVAKAAMDSGVAGDPIKDWVAYKEELQYRVGYSTEIVQVMVHKAKQNPKKVVYPEGEEEKIIRAANSVYNENIARPILLGNESVIKASIENLGYDLNKFEIIDPETSIKTAIYADNFYKRRQRKGATLRDAKVLMRQPNYFGPMMVQSGDADAMVGGLTYHYPQTIRPALQCIGVKKGHKIVSGMYIVVIKNKVFFFADCTVNVDPTPDELAEIAISTAEAVKEFDIIPKIALLSFSNFGSAPYPQSIKVANAVKIIKEKRPDLIVDGEMQADTAVVSDKMEKEFPFSTLKGGANVLIFPTLEAGNIAYKLMQRLTGATVIGPILMGINRPVHVLQRGDSVNEIINMTAIAVVDAKNHK